MAAANLFSVKIQHEGYFLQGPPERYIGGRVNFHDNMDDDEIPLIEIMHVMDRDFYDGSFSVFCMGKLLMMV